MVKLVIGFIVIVCSLSFVFVSCEEDEICNTWYLDADGDGLGNPSIDSVSCTPLIGYVLNRGDDNDSLVNLAANELLINDLPVFSIEDAGLQNSRVLPSFPPLNTPAFYNSWFCFTDGDIVVDYYDYDSCHYLTIDTINTIAKFYLNLVTASIDTSGFQLGTYSFFENGITDSLFEAGNNCVVGAIIYNPGGINSLSNNMYHYSMVSGTIYVSGQSPSSYQSEFQNFIFINDNDNNDSLILNGGYVGVLEYLDINDLEIHCR
ncbi:MAG: hypothetical protein GY751_07930 [Bacteroidetes bacterium]|nr:hypothetical protein [Bacteroidota bacterium]